MVLADIEAPVLDTTVAELSALGTVSGVRTDVSDGDLGRGAGGPGLGPSRAMRPAVPERRGDLGGGGLPWQQEPNDWRWCFGVNVFGVGIGVSEFVPRMLDDGHPGQVVVTSSGDGGFAPVATASCERRRRKRR